MNKPALTLPILISLVVGNMIGTGIYVLPASLAEYGTISILAWFYTGIGAVCLAITFANLNKRFTKTGGPYIYCREAFGKPTGFIIAYTYWASNMVSIAGIAVASIGYLGYLLPILDANSLGYQPTTALMIELAVVWTFTLINIIGLHTAGVVQVILTLIKITPLLLISLIGLWYIHPEYLTHVTTGKENTWMSIGSAATLTFWAFIGLESATIPADNATGSKAIYKATVYGTLLTACIYILSTVVLMGMFPVEELRNSQFPFALAGTELFGPSAASIITIFAVLSGLGALNACVLIQGQMVYAAAKDHLFPQIFAKLSRQEAPVAGQLLSSSFVSLFLIMTVQPTLLQQFHTIILLAALLTLITYMVTALAEIKFVWLDNRKLNNKVIKLSLIPLVATVYAIWMISSLSWNILFAGLILILLCFPIYFLIIRKLAEPT